MIYNIPAGFADAGTSENLSTIQLIDTDRIVEALDPDHPGALLLKVNSLGSDGMWGPPKLRVGWLPEDIPASSDIYLCAQIAAQQQDFGVWEGSVGLYLYPEGGWLETGLITDADERTYDWPIDEFARQHILNGTFGYRGFAPPWEEEQGLPNGLATSVEGVAYYISGIWLRVEGGDDVSVPGLGNWALTGRVGDTRLAWT